MPFFSLSPSWTWLNISRSTGRKEAPDANEYATFYVKTKLPESPKLNFYSALEEMNTCNNSSVSVRPESGQ